MKVLTLAKLRKLSDEEIEALYAEIMEISNNALDMCDRDKAIRYVPRIGKEVIVRKQTQLQKLKDDRLAELELQQAEATKKRLKQLERNVANAKKASEKARAKQAELRANYKAKYGVDYAE